MGVRGVESSQLRHQDSHDVDQEEEVELQKSGGCNDHQMEGRASLQSRGKIRGKKCQVSL